MNRGGSWRSQPKEMRFWTEGPDALERELQNRLDEINHILD